MTEKSDTVVSTAQFDVEESLEMLVVAARKLPDRRERIATAAYAAMLPNADLSEELANCAVHAADLLIAALARAELDKGES